MQENSKRLIDEFFRISKKGWIKSSSKSFGSVGLTFEKELGKSQDSLYFPDYYGTEIKCTTHYSKYPLYLFTLAFDGPTFPEINRIVEKYGYYDKDYPNKKVLYEKLSCISKTVANDKYKLKLQIDNTEEKLFLCVYNLYDELIEKESFVYLDSIRNHLMLKLNKLAIVKAFKTKKDNEDYFRYYKMDIYSIKSFKTFLNLLEIGVIEVSLIARIGKSGNDKGRYRNKNLVFNIKKENIDKLFEKTFSSDSKSFTFL